MRRITGLVVLVAFLASGESVVWAAEDNREQRIRRLTQEALVLRQQGRLDDAERLLADAEQQLKASPPPSEPMPLTPPRGKEGAGPKKGDAAVEFAAGLAAVARNNIEEAISHFERVIAIDPSSFEAHNNLAAVFVEQGRDEDAVAELQAALRLRPDYYRGRKNLAEVYVRLAQKAFAAAAEVAPKEERQALLSRAGGAPESRGAAPSPAPEIAPTAAAAGSTGQTPSGLVASDLPGLEPSGQQLPQQVLSLGEDGATALVLSGEGLTVFEQQAGGARAVFTARLKRPPELPAVPRSFVAVPSRDRIKLLAIDGVAGSAPVITSGGAGPEAVVIDAADMEQLGGRLRPFLTPVLVAQKHAPAETAAISSDASEMRAAFAVWRESWAGKDLDRYVASYIRGYFPKGGTSHEVWKQQRATVFGRTIALSIDLSPPVVLRIGDGAVMLTRQRYQSNVVTSSGVKRLTWISTPDGWRIKGEDMLTEQLG